MTRILVIDDDRLIRMVVTAALKELGYEVINANSGLEALKLLKSTKPDAIITDRFMPGVDGFEFTRRLRREPDLAHVPILVLTGKTELEDKLEAFEAGADDIISKPFEAAELAARLTTLLRRSEALKAAQAQQAEATATAHSVVVHSLRGGAGCSSVAVNLAVTLRNLWQSTTMLVDMVPNAGQVALMLNKPLRRTWANLSHVEPLDIDYLTLTSIITKHETGLDFIASPAQPVAAEEISQGHLSQSITVIRPRYEYIVADLPHDFSSSTLDALDMSNLILLILTPELASVRAAAIALDTYTQLNYPQEKIKLVLNHTFEQGCLPRNKIEATLRYPISLMIPFASRRFVSAINRGTPVVCENPDDPVTGVLEDFAFGISKETDRGIPPASPSEAWRRVNNRLQLFHETQRKHKSRLPFTSSLGRE